MLELNLFKQETILMFFSITLLSEHSEKGVKLIWHISITMPKIITFYPIEKK